MTPEANAASAPESSTAALLRHEAPYWYTFTTYAKQRWYGKRILDVLVEEFRDRTKHYYTWAIHKGLLKVNGKEVSPTYVVCNGDVLTHTAHKHEPPITSDPVRILYRNEAEGRIVVVKPGSVPVHPAGRYMRHTLLELIKSDHGVEKLYTANRIDRLTSGIMVASTNAKAAKALSKDFDVGRVRKAYVCRVKGKFTEQETTCNAPLLGLDRQTGVVISHPAGRESKTIFNRLSYDEATDTSLLFCRPVTGRTHQIRVHAQLLGHPIPNDPIYNHPVWQQYPPESLADISLPPALENANTAAQTEANVEQAVSQANLDTIKYLASTPACATIIESLKNAKDEGEDWSRLKDELRFAEWNKEQGWNEGETVSGIINAEPAKGEVASPPKGGENEHVLGYCSECFLPLLPDPEPESLLIYLHAIRYETDEWSFEDEMPWWALHDWATPGAQQRATQRRKEGQQGVRPPRLELVAEAKRKGAVAAAATPAVANKQKLKAETSGSSSSPPAPASSSGPLPRDREWPLLLQHAWPPADSKADLADQVSPGAAQQPRIVLEVFRGLEDLARLDLLARLARLDAAKPLLASPTSPLIETALHSSYLVLSPALTQIALEDQLPFTAGKHIFLSQRRMDDELLERLMQDRVALGTVKTRNMSARKKKRRQKAAQEAGKVEAEAAVEPEEEHKESLADEVVERSEDGSIVSETDLKSLISSMWASSSDAFHSAVSLWREHTKRRSEDDRWSWRVRVDRSAYKLPTLNTTDIEGHLADCIWGTLNGEDADPTSDAEVPHPVSLKKADLVVELVFAPFLGVPMTAEGGEGMMNGDTAAQEQAGKDASALGANGVTQRRRAPRGQQNLAQAWESNPSGSLMLMVKLEHFEDPVDENDSSLVMSHRPHVSNDLTEGGTAMARFRAYTLASLLPLQQPHAEPLRIWEPCAGTGAVAIELAELLRQRNAKAVVLASDVEELEVGRAREIGAMSGWADGEVRDGVHVEYRQLDLRKVLAKSDDAAKDSGVPSPSSLAGIITDLPWGRRVLAHGALKVLYLQFVQASCVALKPDHYVVALTLEVKTLQRAVKEAEGFARKRGEAWAMRFEDLCVPPGEEGAEVDEQGRRQARELEGVRVVEMGLRPGLCLLRKVAI